MGLACASCGAAHPAGARFCSSCGAPLQRTCPGCGSEQPAGATFCSNCGIELRDDARRAADTTDERQERRVVTVLQRAVEPHDLSVQVRVLAGAERKRGEPEGTRDPVPPTPPSPAYEALLWEAGITVPLGAGPLRTKRERVWLVYRPKWLAPSERGHVPHPCWTHWAA